MKRKPVMMWAVVSDGNKIVSAHEREEDAFEWLSPPLVERVVKLVEHDHLKSKKDAVVNAAIRFSECVEFKDDLAVVRMELIHAVDRLKKRGGR